MYDINKENKISKFLSLVLRHDPSAAKIKLDTNGWANVSDLISGCNNVGKYLDLETLERIVKENDKKRFSFNADHTLIRANQGHSIPVDVELKEVIPPHILYHGTATRFINSIKRSGITRQSRQYVHLCDRRELAINIGTRHGIPVVLTIDSARMAQDGYSFYLSENGVWLCSEIPWRYIMN